MQDESLQRQPLVVKKRAFAEQRQFLVAFFLSLFLGVFGVDRFYLGKYVTGTLKALTLGGLGVWAMSDFAQIMSGKARDKWGRALTGYDKNHSFARNMMFRLSVIALLALALIIGGAVLLVLYVLDASQNGNFSIPFLQDLMNSQGSQSQQINELLNN